MRKVKNSYFGKGNNPPPYDIIGLPLQIKADDIDDDGRFKGWGSTFGGQPDSYGDVIVKGAFKDTILQGGRNGNGIAMLYQHNSYEPIGVWNQLVEKEQGLWVEGELDLNVQRAKETYSLLKKGAMKGLSIGYDLPRLEDGMRDPESYEYVEKGDNRFRYLKKIDLWEISPVTFPANIRATVTDVKVFEGCKTLRDYENALRESNLSRAAAQHILKLIKPSLRESEAHEDQVTDNGELDVILAELQRRNARACDF